MQSTPIHPQVKWAQRKDKIFLSVDVRDIKDEKIDLKPESLKFSATASGQAYEFEMNFFEPINVEESKWGVYGFNTRFILVKKDPSKEYWKRLLKEDKKQQYIQVDWSKYIDEDDEQEEGGKGLDEGWDPNRFQGFDQGEGGADEDDEEGHDHDHDHDGGANLDDLENEENLKEEKQEQKQEQQQEQFQA